MFTVNNLNVNFYHQDKGKGDKRKRTTTCIITKQDDNTVVLGIGTSKYKESDVRIGLPYDKAFGRRQALFRALEDCLVELDTETYLEIWKQYFNKTADKK